MFPLLPFVVGAAAGALAVNLMRADKARQGLDKAQSALRAATVSGLESIESASAQVRRRLTEEEEVSASSSQGVLLKGSDAVEIEGSERAEEQRS